MTNLERYKDEFAYMLNDVAYQPPVCNYFEKIWTYSDCSCCPFYTKDEAVCDYQKFVDWLLEEHKEKIKLTEFEHDVLKAFTKLPSYVEGDKIENFSTLQELCSGGWFGSIYENLSIKEILENCEVEDR